MGLVFLIDRLRHDMKIGIAQHVDRFEFDLLYFYVFIELKIKALCIVEAAKAVIQGNIGTIDGRDETLDRCRAEVSLY